MGGSNGSLIITITDPSRASTPTQGPSTTPLPTNSRRLENSDLRERSRRVHGPPHSEPSRTQRDSTVQIYQQVGYVDLAQSRLAVAAAMP